MTAPSDSLAFLKTGGLSGVYIVDVPLSRMAADIYTLLEPYAENDDSAGFALRSLCEAIAKTMTDVDELVRDGLHGEPGWSAILDASRVPDEGLAWLGQIVGTALIPGDPNATSRARVAAADGIKRGNPALMIAAAQRLLTGNKTVLFTERTSDAWHYAVRTRTIETPSSAAVLALLTAMKPAGLFLDYATFTGILYLETTAAFATYAATTAAKATYAIRSA